MGLVQYVKDTRAELRHVAWPTRTQTVIYTILVAALSVVIALYLGFFDYVFTTGLSRTLNIVAPQTNSNSVTMTQQTATGTNTVTIPVTPAGDSGGPSFDIPSQQ